MSGGFRIASCNLYARASGEITSSQCLFLDLLHIFKTNGAWKLKFGTLVGICRYYGSMQKLVRSGPWGDQQPHFFLF